MVMWEKERGKGSKKTPVVKYIYTAWNQNYKGSRFLKGLGVRPLPLFIGINKYFGFSPRQLPVCDECD